MTYCPRAKSDMTPCVVRDGTIAYAMSSMDAPICVGCEQGPTITGVAMPAAEWKQIVDTWYRQHPRDRRRRD